VRDLAAGVRPVPADHHHPDRQRDRRAAIGAARETLGGTARQVMTAQAVQAGLRVSELTIRNCDDIGRGDSAAVRCEGCPVTCTSDRRPRPGIKVAEPAWRRPEISAVLWSFAAEWRLSCTS